jgi:S-adenosylmethionine decarboxylase proenzyme
MTHHFIGTHILSEFYEIQVNIGQDNIAELINIIKESCNRNKIQVLKDDYFIFDNGGYTLFFLLKESHLSIHFYMEYRAAFVDIFTCGNADAMNILNDIQSYLYPKEIESKQIQRGRKL